MRISPVHDSQDLLPLLLHLSSNFLSLLWIAVRLASGQSDSTTTRTSFAKTSLTYDAPVGRVSVTPEISVDDLEKVIDMHNRLRRQKGAADMQLMRWHSFLATLAEEWVDLCSWGHGQLSQDPNQRSFESVGQSMFASQSVNVNIVDVIQQWYGQEANFDLNTLKCKGGDLCQLYTQVVWSSSREVGCATRMCAELVGLNWRNASFAICNYAPSGGWRGERPFRIGKACTKCETGGLWCEKGLCNGFCQESGLKCVCDATCVCGELKRKTCICNCGIGWYGPDCSEKCVDQDARCGQGPSWNLTSCSEDDENGRVVRRACPVTCKLCQAANSSFPEACSTAARDADANVNSAHQHLVQPILLLWTFAAAWMLTVQWINWDCSFRNQASSSDAAADGSTTWIPDSCGCSIGQNDPGSF